MSSYTVRPLTPAAATRMTGKGTEISPFRTTWSKTEEMLARELRAIGARNVIIMLDVNESDLRLDGRLRSTAKPNSPMTAIAFDTRAKGSLLICCGRFRQWQDNVRGITLGLEALRKLERYGIVQTAEQYEGWRALPGTASVGVDLDNRAWDVIATFAEMTITDCRADPKSAYRQARKLTHPDSGSGSPASFRAVEEAARILRLA